MTESVACASRYTGKERDSESGNDYFGARYYASSMGRWMSPDWSAKEEPVPYAKMDDPQSLNLYGYVRNNPLSKTDSDGHSPNIMVIEEGAGPGNPIGHTAIAITGRGVESYGTATKPWANTTEFLKSESAKTNISITIIKTTPEQDKAAAGALDKIDKDNKPMEILGGDNCSTRPNAALDAAGVPEKMTITSPVAYPSNDRDMPGSAGARAQAVPDSETTEIPKGSTSLPPVVQQFNPPPRTQPLPK
jgi:RHS repeat-associated protein